MANSSNIPGIPLERSRGTDNFDVWQRRAKSYLTIKGCWSVVSAVAVEGEKAMCERVLAEITLLIDPSNYAHIAAATTAKEAWDALMGAYEDKGLTRIVELLKQLVNMRLQNYIFVEDYVNDGHN